jgi:hypothetical protein
MKIQKSLKEKVSFLLIISILSLNLSFLTIPRKAEAVLGVGDIVSDPIAETQLIFINGHMVGANFSLGGANALKVASTFWEKAQAFLLAAMAKLAMVAAKKLIAMITQATVDWINNGFKGSPAYISNIDKFLTGPGGVGDQTIGQLFAEDANFAFLCSPFKLQVKLSLSLGYGYGLERIGCTLTNIARNATDAADKATAVIDMNGKSITIDKDGKINGQKVSDFSRGGGWYSWLKNTVQPQNSPVGGYLIAKANLDSKVAAAQNTKTLDLLNGQGALSYKTCVDSWITQKGEIEKSPEYIDDAKSRPATPRTIAMGSPVFKTEQKCDTKTPGSAITGMLIQKSTSDVRQGELSAAFANGLDAIFGALMGAVLTMALNQLKKGVLDGDRSGTAAYNSALDASWAGTMSDYANNMNNLTNEQLAWAGVDWSNPSSTLPAILPPSSYGTLDIGTTTFNLFPAPATSTPSIVIPGTVGGGNTYGGNTALDKAKNNSNILIDSLIKSELEYKNSYTTARNLLTQANGVFATSSICNMSFNRNDYVLRSLLIKSNVITNIEGTPNSDRTIASIPWNLKVASTSLDNSASHIIILNKAKNNVNGASTISEVIDAMIPVNSTSFNTDPLAKMLESIKTWLRAVGGMYTSPLCPIDLTKVLLITVSTSTTAYTPVTTF